ncbi:ABC transporter permease [Acetobacter papayae]|uniref:ABC transporter permease n=1 Tax=Acetobacter papayae TaxID=1076592 RepID=UPI0005526BCA|nr:ABC transporter permease [Acetobacter papayae]
MRWLVNVALLSGKEFRSLFRDFILFGLILFAFSFAVVIVADGVKIDVSNATVAFIDEDHSALSRELKAGVLLPYFKPPVLTDRAAANAGMNHGTYNFVIDIPPRFEADVLAGRSPAIQERIDATAMTQAGLGDVYLQRIFLSQISHFMHAPPAEQQLPFRTQSRIRFNPNSESFWFTAVMQVVTDATVLSIILVGAAVIREREHGTIEHLLVLPVSASEIAVAKILANGAVIFVASMASLWFVVHLWLGVPIAGSLLLFAACLVLYLFSVTSLGMVLAIFAPTMPQFGLLAVPVYAIAYLLSGAATPIESMPDIMQMAVRVLPTTQFVKIAQAILYRGAGVETIWPAILSILCASTLFLALALLRFRSMLARQD